MKRLNLWRNVIPAAVTVAVAVLPGTQLHAKSQVDQATIEQTVSPIIEQMMSNKKGVGIALAVVKDGRLVFKKGYGFADATQKTPVDPDNTIFHIGSVTKLFTGTAAMQLYEQGKLDLDVSVNNYTSPITVDEPFGKPVTMKNLLTHTGGLHYKIAGTVTPFATVSEPLAQHLKEALPKAARTPGVVSVYSDYGLALAGHVIERASGQSYQQYLRKNILDPLGMSSSGTVLTPERSLKFAMPNASLQNNFPPMDFNYSNFAPATELHSTVNDMSKFMIMQLSEGKYNGVQILQAETIKFMQQAHYSSHPKTLGWGINFRQSTSNGQNTIGHSGSWFNHLGRLTLMPSHELGIYIVMSKRKGSLIRKVTQSVIDLYVPPKSIPKPTGKEVAISTPLSQFSGHYTAAKNMTPFLSRLTMISEPRKTFTIAAENNVLIAKGERYYETEAGLFIREDGLRSLTFNTDPSSQDLYASFDGVGANVRISTFERPSVQGILTILSLCCLVIGLLLQRKYNKIHTPSPKLSNINHLIVGLSIAFIPITMAVLLFGQEIGLHISSPFWVDALFKIPYLVVALSVLSAVIATSLSLKRKSLQLLWPQLIILLGACVYIMVLNNWNLI